MNNFIFTVLLLMIDAFGTGLAWRLAYMLRYESGMFSNPMPILLFWPGLTLALFWTMIFLSRGLYAIPIALSRFAELERLAKATLVGLILLFIATIDARHPQGLTRLFLAYYGILIFIFVGFGRVLIRTWQRRLRWQRKGLWKAIIVGNNENGHKLYDQLTDYPVWGFNVIGFVDDNKEARASDRYRNLGRLEEIPSLVKTHEVGWVLVSPDNDAEKLVTKVLDTCNNLKLRYMIVADQYQMVIGLVGTVEIHGLPLIEVQPQLVSQVTRVLKRLIDIVAGLLMSVVLLVLTIIIGILIKIDSPGPIFYTQVRTGRRGKLFTLLKYRSMVQDAEAKSGAVWAKKNDPRVTRLGRFLRKSHLDEMPQFFNVLLGQMSLVGPRPERPQFVEEFKTKIPLYARRLRVRPGITGWAQVRHKYDETLADVAEKTRYDLFYIDHISLLLDLRILIATVLKMLRGGGHS